MKEYEIWVLKRHVYKCRFLVFASSLVAARRAALAFVACDLTILSWGRVKVKVKCVK